MPIKIYDLNDTQLLLLGGDMDSAAVSELRPRFEAAVDRHTGRILLDMTDIEFIDSSGIGAIVFLFKRLKGQNRDLVVSGLNGQPLEMLKLLRIDRSIDMVDSPADLVGDAAKVIEEDAPTWRQA